MAEWFIGFPKCSQDSAELWPKDSNGKLLLANDDYVETWKGMEECVKLGLTKSIGISNFNTQQIKRVLDVATIKPAVNQVKYYFCENSVPVLTKETNLTNNCQTIDIKIIFARSPWFSSYI